MKKLVAFILSELVELLCVFIEIYNTQVLKLHTKYPKSKKFLPKKIFFIYGTGDEKDTVYMKRYIVWYTEKSRLYIHRFLKSDHRGEWHNHPWPASFLHLRNTYKEEVLVPHPHIDKTLQDAALVEGFGWFKMLNYGRELLQITTIKRDHIHRVELDKEYHDNPRKAPLTLSWSGKRYYTKDGEDDWGFWRLLDPLPKEGIGIPLYYYTPWKQSMSKTKKVTIETSH